MQLFCDALKVLAKNSMVAFLDLVSAVLEESRSRDSVEIRGVDKTRRISSNPRVFIFVEGPRAARGKPPISPGSLHTMMHNA